MTDQAFSIQRGPGVRTDVRLERMSRGRHRVSVLNTTAIPQSFLDARASERDLARERNGGRAPMGDSHGSYQKIAEIPLSLLLEKAGPGLTRELAVNGMSFDQDAIRKLVNDPDYQKLRSDVEGRKF